MATQIKLSKIKQLLQNIAQGGTSSGGTTGGSTFDPSILIDYVPLSQKGIATGVATLDSTAKIPVAQLPFPMDTVSKMVATLTTELSNLSIAKNKISEALIAKGADLTGLGFTQYADKIWELTLVSPDNNTEPQFTVYRNPHAVLCQGYSSVNIPNQLVKFNPANYTISFTINTYSQNPNHAHFNVIIDKLCYVTGYAYSYGTPGHDDGKLEFVTSIGKWRTQTPFVVNGSSIKTKIIVKQGVPKLYIDDVYTACDLISGTVTLKLDTDDLIFGWDGYSYDWDNHSYIGRLSNILIQSNNDIEVEPIREVGQPIINYENVHSVFCSANSKVTIPNALLHFDTANYEMSFSIKTFDTNPNHANLNVVIDQLCYVTGYSYGYGHAGYDDGKLTFATYRGWWRTQTPILQNGMSAQIRIVVIDGYPDLYIDNTYSHIDHISGAIIDSITPDLSFGWDGYVYDWDNHAYGGRLSNIMIKSFAKPTVPTILPPVAGVPSLIYKNVHSVLCSGNMSVDIPNTMNNFNLTNYQIQFELTTLESNPFHATHNVIIDHVCWISGYSYSYGSPGNDEGKLIFHTSLGGFRMVENTLSQINKTFRVLAVNNNGHLSLYIDDELVEVEQITGSPETDKLPDDILRFGWDGYTYDWNNHSYVGRLSDITIKSF